MPLPENIEKIVDQVRDELSRTAYQCQVLQPLIGGNANFVFHGTLTTPLSDGTHEILVKHGEPYASSSQSFPLPTSRCTIEAECLSQLGGAVSATNEWCHVRTPKLFHFDASTNTQVQEYLDNGIDLKNYALKHYPPHTPINLKEQCLGIGRGLGSWLHRFHEWVAQPAQSSLRDNAAANHELQKLKHATYYQYLMMMVPRFTGLLSEAEATFAKVKEMADAELEKPDLQVVHGDFWTGNALLPDVPITDAVQTPMFIVDWEVVSLGVRVRDVGQMMAELYMLKLFKNIDAGTWLVQGFLEGYGQLTTAEAFRVAIHIGCHLIVIGGTVQGWGSSEDVARVVTHGRDMIINGWEKNSAWFESTDLAFMFKPQRDGVTVVEG
ncbi:kinase-like domain-containing protein [Echria macrotheca]|uniref:Kinase-like domain-containing protein n=1 Tax=Echria macrotheca TaxID=438768 RepID=A0AAJ0BAP1_9PEZI|nr:kinase-like domain-containing protein [Echria macrotheca]